MRVFVALNLPKKERQRIHKEAAALREQDLPVRWVEPDHYHLTLKFLGEVRPDRVERIEGILAKIAKGNARFPIQLGGFGAFPTIRRPRVLWLGVEPSPALRCLKQDIEWALAEIGFDRETRAFHPHLTLGRVDKEDGAGAFRGLDDLTASMSYEASFEVKSLELMRSHVSRSGSRYSVVASRNLSDGP